MSMKRGEAIAVVSGGFGGLVNATLCYAKWPVPVNDQNAVFHWHVIPAGFVHGLVLALVAVMAAMVASRLPRPGRWLIIPVVGWCAGYLSWIPLDLSAFGQSPAQAFSWPIVASWLDVWKPFAYFGIVSALLYIWLICRPGNPGIRWEMLAVSSAGALGSLWWWIAWGPWYFSILHGAIWGSLFGAMWNKFSRKGDVLLFK